MPFFAHIFAVEFHSLYEHHKHDQQALTHHRNSFGFLSIECAEVHLRSSHLRHVYRLAFSTSYALVRKEETTQGAQPS